MKNIWESTRDTQKHLAKTINDRTFDKSKLWPSSNDVRLVKEKTVVLNQIRTALQKTLPSIAYEAALEKISLLFCGENQELQQTYYLVNTLISGDMCYLRFRPSVSRKKTSTEIFLNKISSIEIFYLVLRPQIEALFEGDEEKTLMSLLQINPALAEFIKNITTNFDRMNYFEYEPINHSNNTKNTLWFFTGWTIYAFTSNRKVHFFLSPTWLTEYCAKAVCQIEKSFICIGS